LFGVVYPITFGVIKYTIEEDQLMCPNDTEGHLDFVADFDHLYETKEEAEFVEKYHTQKIVKFDPPVWKDVQQFSNHRFGEVVIHINQKYILVRYDRVFSDTHAQYELDEKSYYKAIEFARTLFDKE
jgi:hypothetical protein